MTRELEGKVALVTGAARNIGRAICIALAEAGANIIVNTKRSLDLGQETVRLVEATGAKAVLVPADVTDAAAVERMIGTAKEKFGGIDILVNNAAVRKEAPFDSIAFAEWQQVLSIMLDGAFLCTQGCVPGMRARGGGRIINIGGLTGHSGAKHRVHVVTGKAALAGFTKAVAHDLAADGITANCVVPGLIETERGQHNPQAPQHHGERPRLMDRLGQPSEVAALVRHLCGPQSRYITGQSIHINGGVFMP
ncbi:SDR family NAD(P)-dependent oxidoreductase [Dongia sp.]|uniref:SDR family NAD(P)-dependent oxidoreductase n=1 Tax=Dongia sp. TaxID=1977262 RepID=UPI0035B341CC